MPSAYNRSLDNRIYIVPQLLENGYVTSGGMSDFSPLVLDATSEVTVNYAAEVTSYFVNSGTDNSDHIRNQPKTINFSGVISNDLGIVDFVTQSVRNGSIISALNLGVSTSTDGTVTTLGNPATLYHMVLKSSMEAKLLFSCYVPNIGVINNCVITQVNFASDVFHYNSFMVSLELKEVRLPVNVVPVPIQGLEDITKLEQTQAAHGTETVAKESVHRNPQELSEEFHTSNITSPDLGE